MQVPKNVYALFTRKSQQMTQDALCHSFLHCCRSTQETVYFFQSVFEFFGGALPSDWHFAFFNNSVDLLQFSVQFCLLIFGTRPPCLASIRHLDSVLEGSSVNLQNKNHCFSGWHQTRIYSRFFCSVIYIAQQLVFCILH